MNAFTKLSGLLVLLAAISCSTGSQNTSRLKMTIEKRWQGIDPDFSTGDISPDGKYFTDINWETGELDIIELDSDSYHPVEGSGYDVGGYSWMSAFSNDGEHIAYAWFNYEVGTHELRIYSMNSGESRTLVKASEEVYHWEPLEWKSDDDSLLLAKQPEGKNWEFGFISVADGGYRTVVELEWNTPGGKNPFSYPYATLSPDNAFIGFDYRLEGSNSMDLFIASVAAGEYVPLWQGEGDDRFLFWDDSGQQVYFYSDRSGTASVWGLQVRNGRAAGEPWLVTEDVTGITAIGKTDDGFAIGQRSGDFNAYYATVDFESGEILEGPKMVDETIHFRNNVGAWSGDGDSLAYVQFKSMPGGRESLVIQSITDNGSREVVFPWYFHNKTGSVAWPSKSTAVVVGGSPEHRGLHTLDLRSGQVKPAFDHGNKGFFQRFKTNSDGSMFFIEMRGTSAGIVSMNPKTNETQRLIDGPVVASSTCIAPDDRALAYLRNNSDEGVTEIQILDFQSNQVRTLLSQDQGMLSIPLAWSADGTRLLVGVNPGNDKKGLWSVALADPSNPVFIDLPAAVNNTLVVSPDGRHIAYQGGTIRAEMSYLVAD